MMLPKWNQILKHVIADFLSAAAAWVAFYVFRKIYIERVKFGHDIPIEFGSSFYWGLAAISVFWLLLYLFMGAYRDVFHKFRLRELSHTFIISLIGCILIFFVLLLDDTIVSYKSYYQLFAANFLFHFSFTFFLRYVLVSQTVYKVHNRIIGFNTLIIGSNEAAWKIFTEIESQKKSFGNKLIGFVKVDDKNGYSNTLKNKIPCLGDIRSIKGSIAENHVEEVIIAIESSEHESIGRIIGELDGTEVSIKIIPDMYNILSGQVKMTNVFGTPLIEIYRNIMPVWQQTIKRVFDIGISLAVLILFSPLYLAIGLMVKFSSKGFVFYSHERIGKHGNPFMIHKFRSMHVDAEKSGPQLSSTHDPRITKFGLFMRKTRIDELPQFYNVLKGDMSVVGPRPERQFYIDQIVKQAPHYKHLLKVRPGITSWGQVKYGYAENVDQMVQRLKYDIIYIENMTLSLDIKILIYTVIIMMQGRGK
jgi:exopolysaccharide biosynthesis polyprenyl glycosylphosphotransferase